MTLPVHQFNCLLNLVGLFCFSGMAEAPRFKGSPAWQGGQSRSQHDATVADEMFHSVIKLKTQNYNQPILFDGLNYRVKKICFVERIDSKESIVFLCERSELLISFLPKISLIRIAHF